METATCETRQTDRQTDRQTNHSTTSYGHRLRQHDTSKRRYLLTQLHGVTTRNRIFTNTSVMNSDPVHIMVTNAPAGTPQSLYRPSYQSPTPDDTTAPTMKVTVLRVVTPCSLEEHVHGSEEAAASAISLCLFWRWSITAITHAVTGCVRAVQLQHSVITLRPARAHLHGTVKYSHWNYSRYVTSVLRCLYWTLNTEQLDV